MSDGMEKLSSLIAEMVDGGTFTKDALKRMQDALANAKALEKTVEQKSEELKGLREVNVKQGAEIATLKATEAAMVAREKAVSDREKIIGTLEQNAAVARAESTVYSRCFDTVFRNFTINKSMMKSVPIVTPGNSYPTMHTETESETETVS